MKIDPKKALYAALIICLSVIMVLSLSACTSVTYSVVSGSDGAYYYDVTISLTDIDEEIKPTVVSALKKTITALPLYHADHTSFSDTKDAFIYREYYSDITELYMARGYTGYETNDMSGYDIQNVGLLYRKYTRTYDNIFALIDTAYSRTNCEQLAATDPRYGFATYFDSGIKNVERLFLYNYAIESGKTEDETEELLSHGMISAIAALGLNGSASDVKYCFVYGTDKKSITTNAPKVTDNTSTLEPSYGTLYKDALYYHVWSGNEREMVDSVFTISQTAPNAVVWYIAATVIALIVAALIVLLLKTQKRKPKTETPRESKMRRDPLSKNDNPFE